MKVRLKKEPDIPYDREAVRVMAKAPGFWKIPKKQRPPDGLCDYCMFSIFSASMTVSSWLLSSSRKITLKPE